LVACHAHGEELCKSGNGGGDYTGQQNLTFFVPQTSIVEISSTFYAEFSCVNRIFLSGRVSKIQKNLNVQNSTLKYRGV
jgi:hypothetical protein